MLKNTRSGLVTGGTGFIGSALVRRLSAEGAQVFCLVRPGSPGRSRIENLPGVKLLETESYEGSPLAGRLAGIQADVVFNLASAGVAPGQHTPEELLAGNLGVVAGLIAATAHCGLRRFIHVGSCAEYGPVADGHKLVEDDPLQPPSLYGAAKVCAHVFGTALAAARGLEFITLRPFGVFGVDEAPHRLVPYLIHHLQRDLPVDLTPGEQFRDLLYVDDIVEGLLQAAESGSLVAGSAYNICSGQAIRIREVAEAVARAMNKPRKLLGFGQRPYRPDESMWIVGDNQRFAALTGWAPRISVQDGIRRMVQAAGKA